LKGAPRRKTDGCALSADGGGDGFHDLEGKPAPVLNIPAVLVRALVDDILRKLIYKES
jgi:hypothetical protein